MQSQHQAGAEHVPPRGDPAGGVANFYAGRNIFLTGATGFVGKMTIEALLRKCPEIGTIYVLARAKRGTEAQARVDALTASALFERVEKDMPGSTKKVVAVEGDLTKEGLGITEEARVTALPAAPPRPGLIRPPARRPKSSSGSRRVVAAGWRGGVHADARGRRRRSCSTSRRPCASPSASSSRCR